MKLLVTGGTGFIGGNFINVVPNEVNVFAIARNKNKSKVKFNRNVNWIYKDLDSINSTDFKGIDTVIHFASAGVSPQKATWEELYHINVNCTLSLLRAAAESGVKRIIMSGSYMEYGLSANAHKYISASAALLPTTAYASSKAAAFELAYAFCMDAKISLFYNRIFSAYGEGQFEGNLWPSLRKAALNHLDFPMTNGEQIRDFISVEDVAFEFLQDIKSNMNDKFVPKVRNICSGKGVSILDFASTWWNKWNAKGKLLPGMIPSRKDEPKRFVGAL